MTCRMEWTSPDGTQHRCGQGRHDGPHECDCATVFTFGGPP